jgi:hypothetical protein
MKLEFSQHILEQIWNMKFYQNQSKGSRVVPCGQTNGHDEADSRFPKFYERIYNVAKENHSYFWETYL